MVTNEQVDGRDREQGRVERPAERGLTAGDDDLGGVLRVFLLAADTEIWELRTLLAAESKGPLAPKQPMYRITLGYAYMASGLETSARSELERAIEISGGDERVKTAIFGRCRHQTSSTMPSSAWLGWRSGSTML